MENIVYLDNSATTKPCKKTIEYMNRSLEENWGNPSSLHTIGIRAEEELFSCKEACASLLSCRSDEIYFTGSGTEANNLAITGGVRARAKRGNRIVTTSTEHPSVLNTIKQFEEQGFEVIYLKPEENGAVSKESIKNAITDKTIFVSIMLVNNETGAINPVSYAKEVIKSVNSPALLHCDAVQGFGKMEVKPSLLGADLLTFSGHKIHGPKGIGVLYRKKGLHILPQILGGGQQEGLRSGTEPMPLICGLSGALSELTDIKGQHEKTKALWNYAKTCLEPFVKINSTDDGLPYILNISVVGYRSETILHFLDSKGIFVSSGSACAKGELSHTLTAMGLKKNEIDSAIRISFSRYNTKEDIDRLVAGLREATEKLKRV